MYMVLAVVAVVVVVVVVGFCNNENTLPEPCSLCISMLSSSTFSFCLFFLTLVECDDLGLVVRVLVLVCSASLKSCDP